MKVLNKIFCLLFIALFSAIGVKAENLTIDDKNYNEETYELTVSGTTSFDDEMVSVFDGNKLLSFKTVSSENGTYTVTFKMLFSEDKTVTIKVGDINSTDYEMETLDVKASKEHERSNILRDEGGNTLSFVNGDKFEIDDELSLTIGLVDYDELDEEDKESFDLLQEELGPNTKLVGVMSVFVLGGEYIFRGYEDTENGFKLFLKMDEEDLEGFNKPHVARLLNLENENIEIEEGKEIKYSSEDEGATILLNNIGMYLIYDDLTKDYNFLDNTENQIINLKKLSDFILIVDADLDKFLNIEFDGKILDTKNYTTKSGSTIITFNNDFIASLDEGIHNIKVNFTDGSAETTLNITNVSNPKTNDNIVLFAVVSVLTLAAGAIAAKKIFVSNKK